MEVLDTVASSVGFADVASMTIQDSVGAKDVPFALVVADAAVRDAATVAIARTDVDQRTDNR